MMFPPVPLPTMHRAWVGDAAAAPASSHSRFGLLSLQRRERSCRSRLALLTAASSPGAGAAPPLGGIGLGGGGSAAAAAGISLGLSAHRAGALSFPPFPRLGDAFGSRPHAQTVAVQLDSSAIMHRRRLQQCICSRFILLVAACVLRLCSRRSSHRPARMQTSFPRIRSVLLRPAATGAHQLQPIRSTAAVAATAGSMRSPSMAGGRGRTFQLLLLCFIGALWMCSCAATIHAADSATVPATGASTPLATPASSADARVPVASDSGASTPTAAPPTAATKSDPHPVASGGGSGGGSSSGSNGVVSGSSGGAGTGLASRCAVALRHLVVSVWSALSQVDDVVQASVEALARSWKPSTEGASSAHAPLHNSQQYANGANGNGNGNGKGNGSPRSPSSTSLSVKTQEIQIYLILCGLVLMLLLVICIGLAWKRYGKLIEALADYNPPQR